MTGRERFVAAARGERGDRPPVWLMRQAGRYLPEYRELRARHSFWEVVQTPELAVEATLQPLRRFPLDAAIVFSDILVPLHLTVGVDMVPGRGPVVSTPFARDETVERIAGTDMRAATPWLAESVRRLTDELHPDTAVIGFAGAPATLAAYLVAGRAPRDLRHLKALAYQEPLLTRRLLGALADASAALLQQQIDAGVDAVQIFDSQAGALSPDDFDGLALPALRRVLDQIGRQVPVIYYSRGTASHLECLCHLSVDVLSIDASMRLVEARAEIPLKTSLQGNLDPAYLLAPPDVIRAEVRDMIRSAPKGGYIANLSQGITPDVPIEGVSAFVEAVTTCRAYRVQGRT